MFGTKCYEQAVGFSAMEADELVYVNGGSGSSGCYMGQYGGTPSYAQDMSTTVISYTVPVPQKQVTETTSISGKLKASYSKMTGFIFEAEVDLSKTKTVSE